MSDCSTFSNILLHLCNIGMKMVSSLNRSSKPYWARCLESTQAFILQQIVEEYDPKKIPEEKRFPRLKKGFSDLYECFEEDLKKPFITQTEDGQRIINDEWFRIAGVDPIEEDKIDKDEENDEKFQSNIFENVSKVYNTSKNRGIKIVLCPKGTPGVPESEDVDLEIPISEMLHVAIFLKKCGLNRPLYIFCILYAVYSAFAITVPDHHIMIDRERENFFASSKLIDDSIDERMDIASTKIRPLLEENKDIIDALSKTILDKVNSIPDEDIDEIENVAGEQILKMNKSKGSMMDFFKDFLPGSEDDNEEGPGLLNKSDNDITNLIDKLMQNKGGIDTSKLKDTIPDINKKVEDLKIKLKGGK